MNATLRTETIYPLNTYNMKLILKVPKLVKTQYWKDLSFWQVALHDDDWKFIKNLKINDELLKNIKDFEIRFTYNNPEDANRN